MLTLLLHHPSAFAAIITAIGAAVVGILRGLTRLLDRVIPQDSAGRNLWWKRYLDYRAKRRTEGLEDRALRRAEKRLAAAAGSTPAP